MSCHEKENAVVRTRLDLASDTESSRYALSAIQVVPSDEDGKVWLTATDGRILAAVETEGEVDQRRLMPVAVVKTTKSQRSQGLTVERNGRWEAATRNRTGVKIAVGDDVKGRFPRCEEIIPEVRNATVLHLDGNLLHNLYLALGGENDQRGITLFVPPADEKTGIVESAVAVLGEHGLGVIMPLNPCSNRDDKDRERKRYEEHAQRYIAAHQAERAAEVEREKETAA